MKLFLDSSYDEEFDRIKNLTWYPWVGKEYAKSPHKILIVGESQYATDENGNYDEQTDMAFREDKQTTRYYAGNTIALKEPPAKFYVNLLKTFGAQSESYADFWSKIAYYHFFQNPDPAVSGNRYSNEIRLDAWNCWLKIVNLLQPDICIFCGVSMKNQFPEFNSQLGLDWDRKWKNIKDTELFYRGRRVCPIEGSFSTDHAHFTELLFILHPSRMNNPEQWNNLLKRQFPQAMDWLNSK